MYTYLISLHILYAVRARARGEKQHVLLYGTVWMVCVRRRPRAWDAWVCRQQATTESFHPSPIRCCVRLAERERERIWQINAIYSDLMHTVPYNWANCFARIMQNSINRILWTFNVLWRHATHHIWVWVWQDEKLNIELLFASAFSKHGKW